MNHSYFAAHLPSTHFSQILTTAQGQEKSELSNIFFSNLTCALSDFYPYDMGLQYVLANLLIWGSLDRSSAVTLLKTLEERKGAIGVYLSLKKGYFTAWMLLSLGSGCKNLGKIG